MTMGEAISILSGIRADYSCFDDERPKYHALSMAIKALSDPHNCAGCKYEEMWSEACEKCSRPMVDNYVKGGDTE